MQDEEYDKVVQDLKNAVCALGKGFSPRENQIEMAKLTYGAILNREIRIIRAGTGTGKSFAYLVPSIRAATEHEKKVLVVTSTKALQDQLIEKDLKFLKSSFPNFNYCVLKGRGNYACLQKISELKESGVSQRLFGENNPTNTYLMESLGEIREIINWASQTKVGDKKEFGRDVDFKIWGLVSSTPAECPKRFQCPKGESCFFEKARDSALKADILVVNTSLFAYDLRTSQSLLDTFDAIVFDEAHKLEEIFRDAFTIKLNGSSFRGIITSLQGLSGYNAQANDLASNLLNHATELDKVIEELAQEARQSNDFEIKDLKSSNLVGALDDCLESLRAIERFGLDLAQNFSEDAVGTRFSRLCVQARSLAEEIEYFNVPDNLAHYLDEEENRLFLISRVIDVGELLDDKLWSLISQKEKSVVLTSATVFDWLASRLGIEEAEFFDLGDGNLIKENALIFCPTNISHKNKDPKILEQKQKIALTLISASGGRALVLCTSLEAMNQMAKFLKENLTSIEIFVQNESDAFNLIQRFKEEETSVLIGSFTFFEGIDVPGKSLSLVIIDKLPFLPPDTFSQIKARALKERNINAFLECDVLDTQVRLAQGAGRLIRSTKDKGVVAILDSRLFKSSYSKLLLRSVEGYGKTSYLDEAVKWLQTAIQN